MMSQVMQRHTVAAHHVVQSLCHTVVSGIEQVDFGSLHSYRAAPGDLPGHLQSSSHHGLLVCKHSAGEERWTILKCLLCCLEIRAESFLCVILCSSQPNQYHPWWWTLVLLISPASLGTDRT